MNNKKHLQMQVLFCWVIFALRASDICAKRK